MTRKYERRFLAPETYNFSNSLSPHRYAWNGLDDHYRMPNNEAVIASMMRKFGVGNFTNVRSEEGKWDDIDDPERNSKNRFGKFSGYILDKRHSVPKSSMIMNHWMKGSCNISEA